MSFCSADGEVDVDWTFVVLIAGLCINVAALAFGYVYILPRARTARPWSAESELFNGLREICAAAVAGGLVLICIAFIEIVHHTRFATNPIFPVLFLGSGAISVWRCGFHVGRVSLRWWRRIDDGSTPRGEALES